MYFILPPSTRSIYQFYVTFQYICIGLNVFIDILNLKNIYKQLKKYRWPNNLVLIFRVDYMSSPTSLSFFFYFLNFHLKMCLLVLEREKGEERERDKHPLVASRMHPSWGSNPQPFAVRRRILQPSYLARAINPPFIGSQLASKQLVWITSHPPSKMFHRTGSYITNNKLRTLSYST